MSNAQRYKVNILIKRANNNLIFFINESLPFSVCALLWSSSFSGRHTCATAKRLAVLPFFRSVAYCSDNWARWEGCDVTAYHYHLPPRNYITPLCDLISNLLSTKNYFACDYKMWSKLKTVVKSFIGISWMISTRTMIILLLSFYHICIYLRLQHDIILRVLAIERECTQYAPVSKIFSYGRWVGCKQLR